MDIRERKEIIIGSNNIKRTIFSRQKDVEMINNIKNFILNIEIFNKYKSHVDAIFNKFRSGFLYEKDNNIIGFCIWKIKERIPKFVSKIPRKRNRKLRILLQYNNSYCEELDNIIINDTEKFARRYELNMIILNNTYFIKDSTCKLYNDNDYVVYSSKNKYIFLNSMLKSIEYENHENLSRLLFDKNDKLIINQLTEYCQYKNIGRVSDEYIEKSFNTFHNGYIYKTDNYINGGVMWQLRNVKENKVININKCVNKYLYVLLICIFPYSYKFRKRILHDIELYAQEIGAKYILLEPLNKLLITFYEKNGYSIVSNYPIRLMSKQVEL